MNHSEHQIQKKLSQSAFSQRESSTSHLAYEKEMLQYRLIQEGNPLAISLCTENLFSNKTGHLSDNPLRNLQYLFACFATLATRFSIEGGLEPEIAYNLSDLYIQQIDRCVTQDAIRTVMTEYVTFLVQKMSNLQKNNAYSQSISQAIDYIYLHLHETIRAKDLATHIGINSSYLSTLFKKETGYTISCYITSKKIEAAQNMLKYSDYSYSSISNYLAFSSHSYFIHIFSKYTGMTPKEYRQRHYRSVFL